MLAEQNITIMRHVIEEGLDKHNLDLIDEYFDPNFIENQFGLKPTISGMKEDFQFLYQVFPDYHIVIEDIVAADNKVWMRMACTRTNKGGFMGPPNGKSFKITVMDVVRINNGKIVEHWGVPDRFAVLMQLGLLSQPKSQ